MNKFVEMTTSVSVVDARSFSEAIRRLSTTRPQVSQRIQQLERRLGRVLLNRIRSPSLTDPGRAYYEHACRLLQELEQAEASVFGTDDNLRGQSCLPAPLVSAPRYLASLLACFAERHPQLWVGAQADDCFVNFQEPHFGMALRVGRLGDPCLVMRPTTASRHLLCVSPDYLVRHGVPQHPEELQAYDELTYYNREPDDVLCLSVDDGLASSRIQVRIRIDSGHQLLEGARVGLGLVILPSFLVAEALLVGELLSVLPGYSPDGGQVSAVYRGAQRTPRKILVLGQLLEGEIGDLAPWDRTPIERGLLPPG